MHKSNGGVSLVTYHYECWKCDKWHETETVSAARYAQVRATVGKTSFLLPAAHILYQAAYNTKNPVKEMFWTVFGKCDECRKIKLRRNLWYASQREVWCWRCM